jgi:hypothetical protein
VEGLMPRIRAVRPTVRKFRSEARAPLEAGFFFFWFFWPLRRFRILSLKTDLLAAKEWLLRMATNNGRHTASLRHGHQYICQIDNVTIHM